MSSHPGKPPLVIHVVWEANSTLGGQCVRLAESLYSHLVRDVTHPLSRGIGIPMFMWTSVAQAEASLRLEDAERSAVVPLVTPEMVRQNGAYFSALHSIAERSSGAHRLYPVALSKAALRLGNEHVRQIQSIRLYGEADEHRRAVLLRRDLTHELCRLLLGRPRMAAIASRAPAPIRLFISHAKGDGRVYAEELRDHVRRVTALETFFDANDIAPGYRFTEALKANIETAALVVIKTDAYASREWCRREVLLAKAAGRPVVVVNAVHTGEARSFPYLGNVPTIRWNKRDGAEDRCERLVSLALREVLRSEYFKLRAQGLRLPPRAVVLPRPPELCTVVRGLPPPNRARVLVYPDPPLGDEEVKLLLAADGQRRLVTPTGLHMKSEVAGRHRRRVVGLSIGDSPDLASRGWLRAHVDDAFVECSRHLLAAGFSLAYGGDLRAGGFTATMFDLIRSHDTAGTARRFESYLAWPIHLGLTEETEAELMPEVRFRRIPPPPGLGVRADKGVTAGTAADRYVWARCLTRMRREMTRRAHARLALGGKISGYLGRCPGVVEEVFFAMQSAMPVYLVGAFGGGAEALIKAVTGEKDEVLTSSFQEQDSAYAEMMKHHRQHAPAEDQMDYKVLVKTLRKGGISGLRNGLSRKENEELFWTRDIDRMIGLIVSGVSRAVGR